MTTARVVLTFWLAVLGLVACAPASDEGAGSADTPDGSSGESAEPTIPSVEPCAGLTAEEAAVILEAPVDDLEIKAGVKGGPSCYYGVRGQQLVTLSFDVFVEDSAAAASDRQASMREGFGFVAETEDIADLGDEAFYSGDPVDRMVTRRHNVLIDVLTPNGVDVQRRITEIILENLDENSR